MLQEPRRMTLKELLDLSGKVAIVTGGTKGIGLAASERLAEAGAKVVMAARDPKEGTRAAKELNELGYRAIFLPCDVSKEAEVDSLVETTITTFGAIDILVNNAGWYPGKIFQNVNEPFLDSVLDVNLKGAFFCSSKVGLQMINQKRGGSMVNLSSVGAHYPQATSLAYDISKGGLLMMTRNLALVLAPYGIRVNAVAPGLIRTPGSMSPEFSKGGRNTQPRIALNRIGEAHEVANVILFLASPASSYITGSEILCDGGWTLTAIT